MPGNQVQRAYQDWQLLQQVVAALPNRPRPSGFSPRASAAGRQQPGASSSSSSSSASAGDGWRASRPPRFMRPGPFSVAALPVLKVPLGPSPADPSVPLDLQMEVLVPQGRQPFPVVFFTPGFLLNSSLYRSYAQRLASYGYTVVLWDLSEVLDDTLTVAFMKQAIELCERDARLQQHCDTSALLMMGHSRGAKLSCLIAEQEPRVKGLVLIDPVDNSSFGPQGVGYPSALPGLQRTEAQRQLPVLVVGAALNTDVVPPEANWRRFVSAAAGGGAPVFEVVLKGSAHLQFLDKQLPLFAMFSSSGSTPDDVVRQVTQACMVGFAELALRPGSSYSPSQVQTLLAEEVEALKSLAPLDSSFQNMAKLRTSSGNAAGSSNASSSRAGAASSSSSRSGGPAAGRAAAGARPKPVQATYQQLMAMRAGELKRLLQEHGVDSSDCYEKSELAQRVLQRCSA